MSETPDPIPISPPRRASRSDRVGWPNGASAANVTLIPGRLPGIVEKSGSSDRLVSFGGLEF